MSGKELPPPGGGQDLTEMLRQRRVRTDEDEPVAAAPAPVAPASAAKVRGSMDRRSWYMNKASADALAAIVEDLHFATRKPKHVVLSELVAVALEHQEEVQRRLEGMR